MSGRDAHRGRAGPLDQVTSVRGDSFVVSTLTGDVLRGGETGVYVRDVRVLDQLEVLVDGRAPQPLVGARVDAGTAVFHGHALVEDAGPDPVLLVERRRVVDGSLHEEVRLHNRGRVAVTVAVTFLVGTDFAYIFDVRHARRRPRVPPEQVPEGVRFAHTDGVHAVEVTTDPPPDDTRSGLTIRRTIAPRGSTRICLDLVATDVYGTVRPGRRCEALDDLGHVEELQRDVDPGPRVRCSDQRVELLARSALQDLAALRMQDPDAPQDTFCAAGSPWYLTLFGRDSLWAAAMALPADPGLAGGTLRTLARRQGQRVDPDTEEAPGKVLHEIRRGGLTHRGDLPPTYYGSVDATPLFVVLAHEAWRWGLPRTEVAALLPHVEAALGWLEHAVASSDDGFLAYVRSGERGLRNQGWKDSHDGVQFTDGRLARAPIALSEVQGYAYDAAVRGAELLDRFDRPGGDRWRTWADELAARFRAAFWITDELGPYPVIALDRDGLPVDGRASNMGHLLSTGILDDQEAGLVADRLVAPDMASGWGLRTMSTENVGFNPLGYHSGSVWPHDTAIAVWGLAVTGHHAAATRLATDLVDAAAQLGYRLPELYGGLPRTASPVPVPYPAACRPQAWAAGAALLLLRSCLGLQPVLPDGQLRLAPLRPSPFGRLELDGLPLGDRTIAVRVSPRGDVEVAVDGPPLEVRVEEPVA